MTLNTTKNLFDGVYNTTDSSELVSVVNKGLDTDGEQVFLVTTKTAPDWNGKAIILNADATAQRNGYGIHTYNSGNQLVFGLAEDVNDNNAGTQTITMTDGTKYNVVKNYLGVGNAQNGSYSYTIIPGTTPLDKSAYTVANVNATANDSTDPNSSGSEALDFTLNLNKAIQKDQYLDVQMGLTDSQGKLHQYDDVLAKNSPILYNGQNLATIYNLGNKYRIVFNSDVFNQLVNTTNLPADPQVEISLKWGSGQVQASVNNKDKTYLYQYTNDPTKNKTQFTYQAQNDIQIGDQTYSSNLPIKGLYIDQNKHMEVNDTSYITSSHTVARIWDNSNHVQITTSLTNTDIYQPMVANTDVTVEVGKSDKLTYSWSTPEQATDELEKNLAKDHQNILDNNLKDNTQYFFDNTDNTSNDQKAKFTVTIDNKDTADQYIRVYHISSTDPNAKFEKGSLVSFLTVGIPDFTIKPSIKSYEDDIADQQKKGNYDGPADTNNKGILDTLINTPGIYYQIDQVNSDGNIIKNLNQARYNWAADIQKVSQLDVNNASDVNEIRTVILHFRKDGSNQDISTLNAQGSLNKAILFPTATSTLQGILANDPTVALDKVVAVDTTGTPTTISAPDKVSAADLSKYNFGNYSNDNAAQFIVYLKSTKAQLNIKYIDVGQTDKTLGFMPTDGKPIPGHDIKIDGDVGSAYDATNKLWQDFDQNGYELAEQPENVGKGTFATEMPTQYIYLKHKVTPINQTKKVTETIHYVDQNGQTVSPDTTATLIFKQTGKHDQVTGTDSDLAWKPATDQTFAQVKITPIKGYKVKTATDSNQQNVLISNDQGDFIKAFTGINQNTDNIAITVNFVKIASPTPTTPSNPKTPEKPEKPKTPVTPKKPTNSNNRQTLKHLAKATKTVGTKAMKKPNYARNDSNAAKVSKATVSKKELPITSEKQDNLSLIGILLAGLALLFDLAGHQKSKN